MAAAVGAAALFALLAGGLTGSIRDPTGPAAATAAARKCEQAVVQDWADDGRVDGLYPLACYRRAIERLPSDVRDYSDAPTEIERALAVASNRGGGPEAPGTPSSGPEPSPPLVLAALGLAGVLAALAGAAWVVQRATRPRRRPAS